MPEPVLRLRMEHLLATADLRPPAMPPAAVLIVRRMEDPLPRALSTRQPSPVIPRVWERAAHASLDSLYRSAARPSRGMFGHAPAAVVFEDESEMLACLALDLARRVASSHWWWRAILRNSPYHPGETLVRTFLREPRSVPAAITRLVEWHAAESVAALLDPRQALVVLEAVLREFDLPVADLHAPQRIAPSIETGARPSQPAAPAPAAPPGAPAGIPAPAQSIDASSPPHRPAAPEEARFMPREPAPPWREVMGAVLSARELAPECEALIGVCLMIERAPALALRPQFAERLVQWRRQASQVAPPSPEWVRTSSTPAPPGALPAEPPEPEEIRRPVQAEELAPAELPEDPHTSAAPGLARRHRQLRRTAREERITGATTKLVVGAASEAGSLGRVQNETAGEIRTSVAGALFLVGFLRRLGLLRDPGARFGFEASAGAWAWLEIWGRALAGAAYAQDPLWRWMAACEGREPETELGHDIVPVAPCCLPAGWPGWPPAEEERCRLRYGTADLPFRASPALESLVHFLLPYLAWRLEDALGLASGAPLDETLFRFRGRLYHTRTHVDLVLPLDCASVRVRIAGLDTDPGWVAELGRVIKFHFVSEGST